MEKGFYSPTKGYWQTTEEPSDDIKRTYPLDTVSVEPKPSQEHTLVDGIWVYTPPIEEVPEAISFSQMIIGLVSEGWISKIQGRQWLDGTLPQPVLNLIDQLPVEQQFAAEAKSKRATVVYRNDPIVLALAQQQGKTPTELDLFFKKYSEV